MIESIVSFLQSIPAWGIIISLFVITFVENIFPPSPSDVLVVFIGTMIGLGTVGFVPCLISSTLGSIVGFLVMFWLGTKFEKNVVENQQNFFFRFLPLSLITKVEILFQRYGYGIIVVNRFLSGTRAIISLFAGMSGLSLRKTTILSGVSALLWNAILLYAGLSVGENWQIIIQSISKYSLYFTIAVSLTVLLLYYLSSRKQSNNE